MIEETCARHPVKWWIVLGVLLVLLGGVGQVHALVEDFQETDWTDQITHSGASRVTFTYADCFYVRFNGNGEYIRNKYPYPTNYWAYTTGGIAVESYMHCADFLSEALAYVGGTPYGYYSAAARDRIEFVREGDLHIRMYKNGVYYKDCGVVNNIPYYFRILYPFDEADDIVIGTDEERNVVSCPPQSWFVAKDIFDTGFSGLYDVVDHQVYADAMHCSYATDDGSATVTVTDIATGTVVNTTTVSSYAGIITYNLTTMLFNSGAPYGQYRVAISGSTASDTFWYRSVATSGTSIQWDDTEYEEDEEATMTFSISESNWISDDYSYELRVLDSSLGEIYSKSIAARPVNATDSITIDATTFPVSGTYYATLYATDLSSEEEILLTYDDAYMYLAGSGDVTVSGKTYFALNGTVAGGAGVNITQLGVTHDTTSNVTDGEYEVEELITDWSIGCNASFSGHESYEVFFTPLAGGEYNVDLALVPTGGPAPGSWYDVTGGMMTADSASATATDYWNASLNGTSVGGIVYEAPYWDIANGALVNISNSTWSDTALIGAGGWYQFDNLTQSQYTLSISKDGFATCSGTVTPLENQFTRKDAYLEIEYTLTVNAKDLASLGLITGDTVTISLSTGQSDTTTTGSVTFTGLSYNVYDVVASCEGYYAGYSTIILNEDMTVDVYLQSMGDSSSGPSANYIPHPVRFTYVDATGNPITGATVTAIAQESSNPWSWLSSVFGFNTNLTNINTTLSGTTGHDGTLSFLMVETVQYEVHCVKASAGINHTVDIYPKESEYFIRIGSLPSVGSNYPTYSLNATTVGTNVVLFGNYSDTSGSTTAAYFVVLNSTGSEVHNSSITLTGGVGSAYFSVNNTKGDQYREGIVAFHSTEGTIEKWIDITLKGAGRLIDFGEGWTDFMYLVMSVACIFLVAGCFGEIDVRMGAIFIPITSGIFWFIGWMSEYYGGLITIAGVLGAIYYMRSKAKELDT